ncbi:AcrR family transcriptional regulator [Actinoplanes campanulatus]|uniref:AcrR family transcriptional regulator n=1 Tax=Actinoplanes campanulatus TaxID=113559 RepID=A0A7W5FG63_9ACTN|nr:TetR/AcrR family transcriptional regulator [Actinoplanes campanulatus]MBB3097313.1 AcrR family transcriptional regulator [Actinoplanes campanulatus]GGN17196.1 TetR family transcriptional regulator [Actinoplanes campanulatus]GID37504.1 TetR family transcriptional regulator [Actinoplanes campanulatus]
MPEFTDSVWTRPARPRTGQPTLSREQIVRAAIELLDAEGAAGLSMRRLGARLGSGATSLYWHVANKDDLLELAVDQVMGEIYVPEPGDTPWRVGVSVMADGMRAMLLRHTWVIGLLGVRPTIGPNVMRMGNRSVALLLAAGFTGPALSHVHSLITAHVIGAATTEAAVAAAVQRAGQSAAEIREQLEPFMEKTAGDYPDYARWRQESGVTEMDPDQVWDQSFAFGLERILDGLELWRVNNIGDTSAA